MATMKDVAREAGVGVGTVSRVLNNVKVKEKTRIKVEAAIAKLNYVPNEAGRALKTSESKNIVCILPNISHLFFSELVYFIEEELDQHDYKLLLCNSHGNLDKELRFIELLKRGKVSGVILITDSEISDHIKPEMPVVIIDRMLNDYTKCITSDNYEGGALAARELINSGCKSLQFIGSSREHFESFVNDRSLGFIDEANKKNIKNNTYFMSYGSSHMKEHVSRMFDESEGFDGVFAENDILALNVIQEAQIRNMRIPEDISVIGFDGNYMSEALHPILSTIVQDKPQLAKEIVQCMFEMLNDEERNNDVVKVPISFRSGETTK